MLSPLSSTNVTELRLLSPSSPRGIRGTGGTEDDRALLGDPVLARRSRMYVLFRGCSPRGSVAESWRVIPPDLYFDARASFERMKESTRKTCAKLVPEMAEGMSSVRAEEGLDGRLPFVGSGGGIPLEFSGEERCTLIFVPVTLLGILIGEGVGFLADEYAPWCASSGRSHD